MVPRPGGEADKLGNKYESAWAIRHALYCIVEPARSLTAEDIDEDLGRGAEFTYVSGALTEIHQLKRQNSNSNYWTIKALSSLGIFATAARHVAAGRRYHFVSLIPCGPLKELADRARKAADLGEFTRIWLTDELRVAFDQLSSAAVFGSARAAWLTLRGMQFEVHDEEDVIRVNTMLAELSLRGASGHLISLAVGDVLLNSLGRRLTRTELLSQLAERGITPLVGGSRTSAVEQVNVITESWRGAVQRELLRPAIERAEVAQLVTALEDNRLGLILGTAGGGKSAVLEQTVTAVRESGAEVLALRLDRVEPFASTIDLGRQLGLHTSPAAVLALAANGGSAYLVLDQLDAVSLASGRMPQSFDVVMDLIGEALSVPGIRVLLACREFDVENDHRIRALAERSDVRKVSVALLPVETIETAVATMGLEPALLTAAQLAVLQTPLHLVLLSGIAHQEDALSFHSRGSLFSTFWERKHASTRARRSGVRFNDTLARIANAASDRQTLSVPLQVLDDGDLFEDASVLISEHVLAREGDRISFFHEAFFDYAFARQWVSRDESLVAFLLRDEQELFRRAQVRQILQHLRERDTQRFLQELETLLVSSDVRFHIKEAALAVLGSLAEPTPEELDLVLRLAAAKPRWEDRLWEQLQRAEWFRRFHDEGIIDAWLDGTDDELRSRASDLMARGGNKHGDNVARLLEERPNAPEYRAWVRWVVRLADIHANRRLFELMLAVVREGAYDQLEQELWLTVHDLPKHQPTWAVELLRARLVEHVDALAVDSEGKVRALMVADYSSNEFLRDSANMDPRAFVEMTVPYLLRVMATTATPPSGTMPVLDKHFAYRFPEDDSEDQELGDALMRATARALETLVRAEPDATRPMLEVLANDPHDAAQFLLYRALAAGGGRFANWAAELLLEGESRLYCGYMSDPFWVTREVVSAIASSVDEDAHRELEDRFRDLRNPYEHGPSFGWAAFTFLSALDSSRLSGCGERRLDEYRRKFDLLTPAAPRGIISGTIESPIDADALTKMTDAQWLKAMTKHDKGRRDWSTFKGGAHELSSQLRTQVANDPARFAALALDLTMDVNSAYGDAILMGFGDGVTPTPADAEVVFAGIRHIASLGHTENDRWLGMAVRKHFREVPLDLVDLILKRALSSSDPKESSAGVAQNDGERRRANRLRAIGINTTRGSLAESLGDLLVFDAGGQRTALVAPQLKALAGDPVLGVRSCVAHTIAASLRHSRPDAYSAFERLIDADDLLLAEELVQNLMVYIGNVNPEVIDPVIERMLASENDEAREAGGNLAAFAALEWERAHLIGRAVQADPRVRRGVARMCAARVHRTSNTELATSTLLQLFNDADEDVRSAAAKVAPSLRGLPLRPYKALLEALIESPSYEHVTPQLLITLERAPDKVDDLALKAAQRFLTVHGKIATDIRTSAAGHARYISKLVVRGLAQARDRQYRASLLDVLDELLEMGVYGIGDAITASERL